jgi:hypothetical protein
MPPGFARALVPSSIGDPHVLIGSTIWDVSGAEPRRVTSGVPEDARLIIEYPVGRWFAGTPRGLYRRTAVEWSLEAALGVTPVFAAKTLFFRLTIGTQGAVWTFVEEQWERFVLPWSDRVTALAPSKQYQTPWLACGGRVARFSIDTGEILEVYDRLNSGVCGAEVTGLAEIDGTLWVASRGGIARFTIPK